MALPAPVDPRAARPASPVTPRVLPHQLPAPGICVVIPCLNEAGTIASVVADFRRALPSATVMVFDNSSSDDSAELATAAGADVIRVPRQGKGYVLRHAFDRVKADIYVVVDADATYPADRVMDLIAPVLRGEADMVVGARDHFLEPDAIRPLHRWGNRLIVAFLNLCFGTQLRDILSGYRVLSGEMVRELPLLAPGFEVETELTLETLERGFRVLEVPIQYRRRPHGSQSKLSSFKDGYRILMTIMTLLRDYRPMTFFTTVAAVITLLGLLGGAVVLTDYLRTGLVPRLPLAVLSAAMILLAAVFFVTGFVVSAINRRFAEMAALSGRWREDRLTRDLST
ncbi:MAG TPA: glycosyltransferase family 2 protein [Candidatus Dormibacteraeota bacterium]|jgi:glycosyltransferase involved in cell wall biosynthesis